MMFRVGVLADSVLVRTSCTLVLESIPKRRFPSVARYGTEMGSTSEINVSMRHAEFDLFRRPVLKSIGTGSWTGTHRFFRRQDTARYDTTQLAHIDR